MSLKETAVPLLLAADEKIAALEKEIARLRQELAPKPDAGVTFFASFETSPTEDGAFQLGASNPSRATLVEPGRHGRKAVRLLTSGSDFGVGNPGGGGERCDLSGKLNPKLNVFNGDTIWLAHSLMLDKSAFVFPNGAAYTLFDFHVIAADGSQPPTGGTGTNINFGFPSGRYFDGKVLDGEALVWRVFGGPAFDGGRAEFMFRPPGTVKLGVWYDFVYQIKFSSGADGLANFWGREGSETTYKKYGAHRGPTLYSTPEYPNMHAYLKLANYHGGANGKPSAVIHDFVVRAPTLDALHNAFKEAGVKLAKLE